MTTTTITTAPSTPTAGRSLRLVRALRSEILNLRSTPTATALLAGSVVMAVASCVANLSVIDDDRFATEETIELAMHASTVATFIFALVAGVVSSTSDFRFGRIDQALLSEPDRSRFFAAKALAGALMGMVYGIMGAVTAAATTASVFAFRGATLDLGSAPVVQPLIGVVLAAALFAAIGIGVGTAIQNQPAAIAGSLAAMLIVEPTALLGLPSVGRWLPAAAGLALTNSPDPNLVAQTTGAVTLAAWALLALAVGDARLRSAAL